MIGKKKKKDKRDRHEHVWEFYREVTREGFTRTTYKCKFCSKTKNIETPWP